MIRVTARVRNGRLVVDEPTDEPEGSEIELVAANDWNDLDDDERRRLHESLAEAERDIAEGRLVPAEEVLTELRSRRGS